MCSAYDDALQTACTSAVSYTTFMTYVNGPQHLIHACATYYTVATCVSYKLDRYTCRFCPSCEQADSPCCSSKTANFVDNAEALWTVQGPRDVLRISVCLGAGMSSGCRRYTLVSGTWILLTQAEESFVVRHDMSHGTCSTSGNRQSPGHTTACPQLGRKEATEHCCSQCSDGPLHHCVAVCITQWHTTLRLEPNALQHGNLAHRAYHLS